MPAQPSVSEFDYDLLADMAISQSEIEQGISPTRVALHSSLNTSLFAGSEIKPASKSPGWTQEEINYLIAMHAKSTDAEIAEDLGRTETAIRVKRKRLKLPQVSTAKTEYYTAHYISVMLGIDVHKVCWWIDKDFLKGHRQPGLRQIRLVKRMRLRCWVTNPTNWIYFNPLKVRDPELKKLIARRMERWNDEWWTTRQVADYHGVTPKDILRFILTKQIDGVHIEHSLGGRNPNQAWANWFVKKSEATRPDLCIWTRSRPSPTFTARAIAWIIRARDELYMPWDAIGRSMGLCWHRPRRAGKGVTGTTVAKYYLIEKNKTYNQ